MASCVTTASLLSIHMASHEYSISLSLIFSYASVHGVLIVELTMLRLRKGYVTTMFTYQTPTRHALLAAQKRCLLFR